MEYVDEFDLATSTVSLTPAAYCTVCTTVSLTPAATAQSVQHSHNVARRLTEQRPGHSTEKKRKCLSQNSMNRAKKQNTLRMHCVTPSTVELIDRRTASTAVYPQRTLLRSDPTAVRVGMRVLRLGQIVSAAYRPGGCVTEKWYTAKLIALRAGWYTVRQGGGG
jgi:hypothetical protein